MEESLNNIPTCCIIGNVDVGKTKLLDLMRNNNSKEANGITQQIGATSYSNKRLKEISGNLSKLIEVESLLMIDTPGHDCFSTMRYIALTVSDIVIVLIDINGKIENETLNCLKFIEDKNKLIIFVVNKIDTLNNWNKDKKFNFSPIRKVLNKQNNTALSLLETKLNEIKLNLSINEINSELYYKNNNQDDFINIVPISAVSGEGVPDLITLISKKFKKNEYQDELFGYILDKRKDSKNGEYYVCIHKNGQLNKNDIIKINDENVKIKKILEISEDKELKDSHIFSFSDSINNPKGFGLIFDSDTNFEPGDIYIKKNSELKDSNTFKTEDLNLHLNDIGVVLVAPSKILMDALVKIINKEKIKIYNYKIGSIDKNTIIMSSKWKDLAEDNFAKDYYKKFNLILYFNPSDEEDKIDKKIKSFSEEKNSKIIFSNSIYQLVKNYNLHNDELAGSLKEKYPNIFINLELSIISKYVFLKNSPLLFGVKIIEGELLLGMELIVNNLNIGKVIGIKLENKDVNQAKKNDEVCIKIENPKKYTLEIDFTVDDKITNNITPDEYVLRRKYDIVIKK